MSMGAGGSDSSQSSRPANGAERADILNSGVQSIGSNIRSLPWESYATPQYVASGAPRTLSGSDYGALQKSLTDGYTAGLDYSKQQDLKNVNQDLANRGIWSSGLADKAITDREAAYAPQYAKAGADATNARYGLQSAENGQVNQFNQAESAARNSFNNAQAQSQYTSKWAPLNYLKDLYNQTGGTFSNGGSTSGQGSFSI